jgi:hypothetical protein
MTPTFEAAASVSAPRRKWKYSEKASDFHGNHNYAPYTMAFNAALDKAAADEDLTAADLRAFIGIIRHSWGNLSDVPVDGMPKVDRDDREPSKMTQEQFGRTIMLSQSSVSQAKSRLRERGYLKSNTEDVYPDDQQEPSLFGPANLRSTSSISPLDSASTSEGKLAFQIISRMSSPFVRYREEVFFPAFPELRTLYEQHRLRRDQLRAACSVEGAAIRRIEHIVMVHRKKNGSDTRKPADQADQADPTSTVAEPEAPGVVAADFASDSAEQPVAESDAPGVQTGPTADFDSRPNHISTVAAAVQTSQIEYQTSQTSAGVTPFVSNTGSPPLFNLEPLIVKEGEASRQASPETATPDACLPAEPTEPTEPTDQVPLRELRAAFPGETITDRSLRDLESRLAATYHDLYDRSRFIGAVFERQRRRQPIGFGLLQKFEAGYFVADHMEQERRAATERNAAKERAEEALRRQSAEAEAPDDPVASRRLCPNCGGLIETLASGSVSLCACQIKDKLRSHGCS